MKGALLINKSAGISSFGVIESLQQELIRAGVPRRQLPKMGHGGTLDPFATGLLIVLVGGAVKLARYFLGELKAYEGTLRLGETTVSGDYTNPISETCSVVPQSLTELQEKTSIFTTQPYLQTPPMHSAKKRNGQPLYKLARAGIEVERTPKVCQIYDFNILSYELPRAQFHVKCSSGTYVRTLAQDFAKTLHSLALLESLHRSASGIFSIDQAWTFEQIAAAGPQAWEQLPCWVPFDRLLAGYSCSHITAEEHQFLVHGKQEVLDQILPRVQASPHDTLQKMDYITLYHQDTLVGVAHKDAGTWRIERVFIHPAENQ